MENYMRKVGSSNDDDLSYEGKFWTMIWRIWRSPNQLPSSNQCPSTQFNKIELLNKIKLNHLIKIEGTYINR